MVLKEHRESLVHKAHPALLVNLVWKGLLVFLVILDPQDDRVAKDPLVEMAKMVLMEILVPQAPQVIEENLAKMAFQVHRVQWAKRVHLVVWVLQVLLGTKDPLESRETRVCLDQKDQEVGQGPQDQLVQLANLVVVVNEDHQVKQVNLVNLVAQALKDLEEKMVQRVQWVKLGRLVFKAFLEWLENLGHQVLLGHLDLPVNPRLFLNPLVAVIACPALLVILDPWDPLDPQVNVEQQVEEDQKVDLECLACPAVQVDPADQVPQGSQVHQECQAKMENLDVNTVKMTFVKSAPRFSVTDLLS